MKELHNSHSHDPEIIRKDLCQLLDTYSLKVEYLSAASAPLNSVATSTSVLTFLSMLLFLNSSQYFTRLLAGLNIILLLLMVFTSLITQIMINSAKLRLARINHDRSEYDDFKTADPSILIRLSHLAQKSSKVIDRIQWLYVNGLFRVLYLFLIITVSILILLILLEIPMRLQSIEWSL